MSNNETRIQASAGMLTSKLISLVRKLRARLVLVLVIKWIENMELMQNIDLQKSVISYVNQSTKSRAPNALQCKGKADTRNTTRSETVTKCYGRLKKASRVI